MASEDCAGLQNLHRLQPPDPWRMDLLVCQLNADPAEPLLERVDHHRVGISRLVLADIQKNPLEAKSKLFLVPQGEIDFRVSRQTN